MTKLFQFVGTVTCFAFLGLVMFLIYENFTDVVENALMLIGTLALIFLIVKMIYGKTWLIELGKEFFIGNDLIDATENYLNAPKPDNKITANLVGHLVYRFTRLGIIGLFLACIPIWLLYNQNELITIQNDLFKFQNIRVDEQTRLFEEQNKSVVAQTNLLQAQDTLTRQQNELTTQQKDQVDEQIILMNSQNQLLIGQNSRIDTQNYRLNIQNYLIEADRNSSLIFLMNNILDKVDDEINEQRENSLRKPDEKYSLSEPLLSRIIALSKAFRPYRLFDTDTLTTNYFSLERGQLFTALMENNLNTNTQNLIVSKGDFENAVINKITLTNASFINANLKGASLRDAMLIGANFTRADLRGVDFGSYTFLLNVNFEKADLSGANLSGAELQGANFSNANLNGINLTSALVDYRGLLKAKSICGCKNIGLNIGNSLTEEEKEKLDSLIKKCD